MLITGAKIGPDQPVDLRIAGGRIADIGEQLHRGSDEPCIDGRGCVVLPGLHDHHMHLLALAAARTSVRCGPPEINSAEALAHALADAARRQPAGVRGIGYHEGDGATIDRHWLDRVCGDTPVRIQHRSGRLWILSSRALAELRPDGAWPEGAERGADGALTGRFYHVDAWLREHLPVMPPLLQPVSVELASYGITGVTDAGPENDSAVLDLLAVAQARGELRQRVLLMGTADLPFRAGALLTTGPHKIYLREPELPDFDALCAVIRATHARGRQVAFHCVTRTELQVALTALDVSGARSGDRIEHASIADAAAIEQIAALKLTVVTQPNFIYERGDQYLRQVEPDDVSALYRGASFLRAGVHLAAGTDAPFGDPDPWLAIRSAINRRTRAGSVLDVSEMLTPERALGLFLGSADKPAQRRTLDVGAPADLCLLHGSWRDILNDPTRERVRLTLRGGEIIWRAGA